ncbi:MAG: hypothetical protein NXI32_27650 [bacterium]|nr:hypothetical protein [bacterium]
MATGLVECLKTGKRPSLATMVDFGIETNKHYVALQNATSNGVTAYDLDRVLGDGPAITWLVSGAIRENHPHIQFRTAYDGLVCEMLWPSK